MKKEEVSKIRERETKNGNYSCEYRQNSLTVGAHVHFVVF